MDSNQKQAAQPSERSKSFPFWIGRGLIFAALLVSAKIAGANTFYVNSIGNLGDATPGDGNCRTGQLIHVGPFFGPECTLRAAIHEANSLAGPDTIAFALQLPLVAGTVSIQPSSPLPAITSQIVLDGYSAPGYDMGDPNAIPVINLIGSLLPAFNSVLHFRDGSSGSVVRGLAIHSAPGSALLVDTNTPGEWIDDVGVEGCHFGISRGQFYLGNAESGLRLRRVRNARIGRICDLGGCTGRRNVSSANGYMGISVAESEGVTIQGNLLGTDLSGNLSFVPGGGSTTNGFDGIRMTAGTGNIIGGDTHPESGNLISGNANYGINIAGNGHFILGNRIGTNAAGTSALPNGLSGVRVDGEDNQIGTHTPHGMNIISGNEQHGVVSIGGNRIVGNTIGLSPDQMTAVGNQWKGIDLSGNGALVEHNIVTMNGIPENWPSIGMDGNSHEFYSNVIGTNDFGTFFGDGTYGIRVWGNNHVIGEAGRGNVIAFHLHGISDLSGAHFTVIRGNWIGTDSSGADLGNFLGISLQSDSAQVGALGGLLTGEGNVIANNLYGVSFSNWAEGNVLYGNRIGRETPPSDLADPQVGVQLYGSNNVIGGDLGMSAAEVALAGNVISNLSGGGVRAESDSDGNTIRGNIAYGHVDQPAIDLGLDGDSPNDHDDVDLGANRLQNHPAFDLAQTEFNENSGDLDVRYKVNSSVVDSAYPLTIDFYLRTTYDAEADVYIGSDMYSEIDATFYRTASIEPLEGSLPIEGVLVATATDSDGNTSELSRQWVPVPEPVYAYSVLAGTFFTGLLASRKRVC